MYINIFSFIGHPANCGVTLESKYTVSITALFYSYKKRKLHSEIQNTTTQKNIPPSV